MASFNLEVVYVQEGSIIRYWIGSRLLGFTDLIREVFVDMWDEKLAVIVRPEQ